ncbi:MAG: glycosyltransferase family 4 protein [Phycisphaerales bacterium]|nr:glycosyltransferase family 4 protein [Phycisphaerales bacterium]
MGPAYWHHVAWEEAGPGGPDVLVLPWDVHYLNTVPALRRAASSGVATLLWGHGYSKNEQPWRRWVRDGLARLADGVVLYNQSAADALMARQRPLGGVYVAPNSLDQAPIQASRRYWRDHREELAAFQQAHSLSGVPVLLFVSRLTGHNRVAMLIEAAAELRKRHRGLRVAIVGDGPGRAPLEEKARELSISDAVSFVGPQYDEQALGAWFMSADVLCYPVNIGLSILHAFGYGVPVVTSNRIENQNPEIEALRAGENGLLYEHGSVGGLTRTLDMLLSDAPLRERLGAGALATVTNAGVFTLDRMVDGLERAIRGARDGATGEEHTEAWAARTDPRIKTVGRGAHAKSAG